MVDILKEFSSLDQKKIMYIGQYIKLLENTVQNNKHHQGSTTLQHSLDVVDELMKLLLFLKIQENNQRTELKDLLLTEHIFKEIFNRFLNSKVDGVSKRDLVIYSAFLHDIGKLNILKMYDSKLTHYNFLDHHHFFGSFLVGTSQYCLNNIDNQLKEFNEKLNLNLSAKNKTKLKQFIAYLNLISKFIKDHYNLLDSIVFTEAQLSLIRSLIENHHKINKGDYLYFKNKSELSKELKKKIKLLKRKNIYEGILLLYYSDTMSCIASDKNEVEFFKKFMSVLIREL